MFRFFTQGKWLYWSWAGSFIILFSLWFQVQIDVKINNWFGQFYDMNQKALSAPNSITHLSNFFKPDCIAVFEGLYIFAFFIVQWSGWQDLNLSLIHI